MDKLLNKIKGDLYEKYVLEYIINNNIYEKAWLCKDIPDEILINLGFNLDNNFKIVRHDFGADIIAMKNDIYYFIQCKNYDNIISIDSLAGFSFLLSNYNLNGVLYYNGILSRNINIIKTNKIEYINLQYDNTEINNRYNTKTIVSNITNNIINYTIRDYQKEAYNLCLDKKRAIIAIPCGMGKGEAQGFSLSFGYLRKNFYIIFIIK